MKLRTSCRLSFDISVTTPFILMLRPRSGAQQLVVSEEITTSPAVHIHDFTDGYGNLCQRLVAQEGNFSINAHAEVHTTDSLDQKPGAPYVEVQHLPDHSLHYLLPSRYCETEHFGQLASEIVADRQPGYDQVKAIEEWIRANIHYDYRDNSATISAQELLERKRGVCRDFAHLGIALCRSLVIPARLVAGYLWQLSPMDMHAWFEAFVGDRWYSFDATQPRLKGGYVIVGIGRDAADVALYNQFGPPIYPLEQSVRVERLDGDEPSG